MPVKTIDTRSAIILCSMTALILIASAAPAASQPTLKDTFKDAFLVGAALNNSQFSGAGGSDQALIVAQFNSVSPENVMKWAAIHPAPERYDFAAADRFVEFGRSNGMFVVGHTLVWHSQTPRWVFQDAEGKPVDRETLLKRMRDHIAAVVGRYQGRVGGWDVVNEALAESGTLRRSAWTRIIGEEYVLEAFRAAHQADPKAELYYNDFSLENEPKRSGAVNLIRKLQAQGVPVAGVGLQGHYKMDWPTPEQLDKTIQAFAAAGVKVMVTELDLDILPQATVSRGADVSMNFELQARLNPYTNGLPPAAQQQLANRYAELFEVLVKNRKTVSRVTFWGVTDGTSWLNNWPVRGRTSYPLLFDRNCRPKPAFDAVIRTAGAK